PYANLRIGGLFAAADGTHLECIRRKGRTNTLRGADDVRVCDESRLLQLLGGMDEKTYTQRFGIDYPELRRGGEAIVQGSGDLGEILFAAGAGVADIRAIQKQIDADADALFTPRGTTRRIGQSLSELDRIRKEIRDAQASTAQWDEQDRELRKAEKRQREIDGELTQKRIERNRLDRIGQSLPLISRLRLLREAWAGVATARLLPESFEADRRELLTTLSTAIRDESRARQEIERLESELRSVNVPTGLLEHRLAVSTVSTEFGSYQKAAKDRPGLIADRDAALKNAEERCRELSQPTTLEEAASLCLPRGQRRRIQELAGDCKALIEMQSSHEAALQELDRKIRQTEDALAGCPQRQDLSELDRTVRQVQKSGDLDAQLSDDRAEIERLREQARVARARLTLYDGTLEDLETLPLPSVETIDRFENDLAEADRELRRCQEKVEELSSRRQNLQSRLEALCLAGEVPTEAELAAVRRQRNTGWELVLQVWQEGLSNDAPAVIAFVDELAPGGDLKTGFRASLDRADSIADRLRREADRVVERAKLTADLQHAEHHLQAFLDGRGEALKHREELGTAWKSQWSPARIDPLTPREMRSWRTQQQALVGLATEMREREADLQRLITRRDAFRSDLHQCLEALGRPASGEPSSLSQTLDDCQEIAGKIRLENQTRERLEQEQDKLRGQRPSAEREADEARERLDAWRAQWADAVTVLGLGREATPTEANTVIETIDELLQLLDEAAKLEVRIRGIDEDADQFQKSVRNLLEQVAPDLLDTLAQSVNQSVDDLVDRLNRAMKDQTKVDGWQEQLQGLRTSRRDATARREESQQALDALCTQAGCQSPEELPHAEEKSTSRRQIESDLQGIEERLHELASGMPLEEWITAAEKVDADRIQVDLAGIDEAIHALEEEKKGVSESIGEHRTKLELMNGGGRAAEAQIQAECLLASIRRDAEDYIRKRLASTVLTRAIDRFRESSQGPVLTRAAELFSMLTRGSFSGLRADSDDGDKLVLVGVRPGGQTVTVAGMSDGTCDQIYLSLRIALLESSLNGREPLPFIVDDVLIKFDNERTAAALKVLSQLSQTTQVILFTHHEHLVQIAQDTLADDEWHVVRL
ncbi:MAG: AAA family ATPase, partial [Planctomycetaceae bacterium]|nr:AAA family ATPase [Planctomycetaceae bacterium]